MEIEYDIKKSNKNSKERGLSFELVKHFEIDTALIAEDSRFEYDEHRFNALWFIGSGLYNLAFTMRGDVIRVISLRRADNSEKKRYALNN